MEIKLDPSKEQHLLVGKEVLELLGKEINQLVKPEDKIIEIGSGTGILTEKLINKAKKLLCFEIDKKFERELSKFKEFSNIKIIYEDCLKYDWRGYNKIIASIPYSLSGPVIEKAIWDNIKELLLIVGEKFKSKLLSRDNKIGIIANLFFRIKQIQKIEKENFTPIPSVDSFLIKLERKKKLEKTDRIFGNMLLRNGKIKNSLIYALVSEG